jgi:O-methyltransferase
MTALTAHAHMAGRELTPAELYLDLLKKCLTRSIFGERFRSLPLGNGKFPDLLFRTVGKWLARKNLEIVRTANFDPLLRAEGVDWPEDGETMIGLRRLQNLQDSITDVVEQNVKGDLIETGVWRGGATIFMRGVLKALGDKERTVWVADSFEGLPPPSPELFPADEGANFHLSNNVLGVTLDQVKANFARYGLLDDQVRFLKGWFKDTLPTAPIERLAVLRLDGDLYESTTIALRSLYPKLSIGGYVIIDDYAPTIPSCVKAVHDFRTDHNIAEEMTSTGEYGVFWKRLR